MSLIEQALRKQQQKRQQQGKEENKVESVEPDNDALLNKDATAETTDTAQKNAQQVSQDVEKDLAQEEVQQKPRVAAETNNKSIFINEALLSQKGFIVASELSGQRTIKEEFRQIKRKILNNAFGPAKETLDNPNLIMVTSAKPNEGKTFISINLALSVALEQDKTVLLVDADVLKPSILKELGVKPKAGLIDYLMGDVTSIGDIIYDTNISKLKVMPAGKTHHLANELLASERMAKMTTELSERYSDRLVIFDSPPLLGINETSILSNLMGQALITVEENKTNLNDVKHANHLLRDELAKGLVLNKAFYSQKESYGYYGYGYGYGENNNE
ncbi:XrtA-associated tyrosine autokinase [Thalassotalea sp. Y01]|uniref:XrtA-associated tyrosine autokinase n=1 Tax=Thalassotalea sp. Y01 TaxID=2729613 RepID=UPI00145D37BD|nr:XrtA-associated tyrosine autokinase [Thalassotalea sp. Y01]NMP16201.1 AAA family ATPase [Thalassotalea sp. Y01]